MWPDNYPPPTPTPTNPYLESHGWRHNGVAWWHPDFRGVTLRQRHDGWHADRDGLFNVHADERAAVAYLAKWMEDDAAVLVAMAGKLRGMA